MNTALDDLPSILTLSAPESKELSLAFGLACVQRVEHLLVEPEVIQCLRMLEDYVAGRASSESLSMAAQSAAVLATRHQGSNSIDGCGHAAVSATYGVSKALAGKAMEAAHYCAYAAVYAGGGYAAVADRDAFEPETTWQAQRLQALVESFMVGSGSMPVAVAGLRNDA